MTDYDAQKDAVGSYYAAIEAKRLAALASIKREVVIGDCRLLLGDCREILPVLEPFDCLVTDPPYGISITKSNRLAVSRGMGGKSWDDAPITAEDVALIRSKAKQHIIWGGNYFHLPPTRAPLVWDKNNAGRDFADFELAWSNLDMVARRFVFRPMNMDGGKVHPTQKPIQVMSWCLSFLPEARSVLDPFMGSGTTGIAAIKAGKRFTGIEIDEGYFAIACDRIQEAYRSPDMFVEAARVPEPVQEAMNV